MEENLESLLEAIELSPLLEDEQKWSLIFALEEGAPYPLELVTAVVEFGKASASYLSFADYVLQNYLQKIDEEIRKMNDVSKEEDPKIFQEKARKIIAIVNNFMTEADSIEKELEKNVEKIVREKGETSEVDAIHQFLQKPTDPN